MNNQIYQEIGTSAYGKYSIEVIKSGGNESYFPFGTGYQNNVVLDEFFIKIFSGSGFKFSTQAFMQTCITNTGSAPATRFDTTGTFGVPNDATWGSNFFGRYVVPNEGRIVLTRDFSFNQITGSARTYREAMVGFFYTDRANRAEVRSMGDIAVSHFVFPEDIVVGVGERLRINYIFNIVLDYLKTNNKPQIQLTGNGYNFGGELGIMTNDVGLGLGNIFGDGSTTIYNELWGGTTFAGPCAAYKDVTLNENIYNYTCVTSSTSPMENHNFGPRTVYRPVFYGSGSSFVPQSYPARYPSATNIPWADSFAVPFHNNLVIDESGNGYVDVEYFFSPHSTGRNISGIIFSRGPQEGSYPAQIYAGIYLKFNTGQFIPATMPLSMKLRWFWRR